MEEKKSYNMKSDISNIDINIDEDIKKDIKDFYFSKKDLENIKIPLDLDDIIDEPFKEEKKEKKLTSLVRFFSYVHFYVHF